MHVNSCRRLAQFSAASLLILTGPSLAAAGDFYLGATVAADRASVQYEKIVDNTNPANVSVNQGRTVSEQTSAAKLGSSYGFLAGYKLPLSVSGVFLAVEGDVLRHGGLTAGQLLGTGQADRRQLGEVWPEEWNFKQQTSYGVTGRLGVGIPLIGNSVGPSVYGLVGMRRLSAQFRSEYTGCARTTPCTEPGHFESGSDSFDENFGGLTFGGGIEQKVGLLSIRGEVRVTDYSNVRRVIPFDDLSVSVPLDLEPKSLSVGLAVLWYF